LLRSCNLLMPTISEETTRPAKKITNSSQLNTASLHPAVSAFPERVIGSACASSFSRLARRSLAFTACTLAPSPIRDALSRRLQPFRCLHACSGCFRLERLPGGTCTHWKAPPCHGAHPIRTFRTFQPSPSLPRQMTPGKLRLALVGFLPTLPARLRLVASADQCRVNPVARRIKPLTNSGIR
jgi:hypothetical protein